MMNLLKTAVIAAIFSMGMTVSAYAAASTTEAVEHVIEITGFKFIPESVTVKSGDKITWVNKDIAPHTATADDSSFDTGTLKQNESKSITTSSDQTISYYCRFHPSMKATLTYE